MKVTCYLEDVQGVEYRVIADVEIELAQIGGWTDPSWDASWYVYAAHNMAGIDVLESLSVEDVESINNQVCQYFEDESTNYEERDCE